MYFPCWYPVASYSKVYESGISRSKYACPVSVRFVKLVVPITCIVTFVPFIIVFVAKS